MILLLVLLLAIVDTLIYPTGYFGDRGQGGWNIVAYLLFYICGYLIFANPRIMEVIKKFTWIALAFGTIAFACLIIFFIDEIADPTRYLALLYLLWLIWFRPLTPGAGCWLYLV